MGSGGCRWRRRPDRHSLHRCSTLGRSDGDVRAHAYTQRRNVQKQCPHASSTGRDSPPRQIAQLCCSKLPKLPGTLGPSAGSTKRGGSTAAIGIQQLGRLLFLKFGRKISPNDLRVPRRLPPPPPLLNTKQGCSALCVLGGLHPLIARLTLLLPLPLPLPLPLLLLLLRPPLLYDLTQPSVLSHASAHPVSSLARPQILSPASPRASHHPTTPH